MGVEVWCSCPHNVRHRAARPLAHSLRGAENMVARSASGHLLEGLPITDQLALVWT